MPGAALLDDPGSPVAAALLAPRLRRRLRSHGGFTVDHRTGSPVGHGVAVCVDPRLGLVFPWPAWDDAVVARWLDAVARPLAASAPGGVYLGGWLDGDPPQVWLDVVRVVPPGMAAWARAAGRAHRQHALFDLGRSTLVPLGAS
jgi:hypothetical protein